MQDNEKDEKQANIIPSFDFLKGVQLTVQKNIINQDPFKHIRHIIGGGGNGADIGEMSGINKLIDNIENENRINIKELVREVIEESKDIKKPTSSFQAEKTGFDLGYTDTQLESLYVQLITDNFIDKNTQLEHFKNAFNGTKLVTGFKPLKWIEPTMGAVFFFHVKKTKHPQWTKYSYLFEPANYKQLLSQSRQNGTFDALKIILEKIIL